MRIQGKVTWSASRSCRRQELAWIEQMVEEIETALEQTGVLDRPERVPAMCFLDLVGYTRLTEEQRASPIQYGCWRPAGRDA